MRCAFRCRAFRCRGFVWAGGRGSDRGDHLAKLIAVQAEPEPEQFADRQLRDDGLHLRCLLEELRGGPAKDRLELSPTAGVG